MRTRVAKFAAACLLCLALGTGAFFAVRAHERQRAEIVLRDLRLLEGAVDFWTISLGKTSSELPTWKDCKPYLRADLDLVRREGRDILGHPYVIGTGWESVSVDPRTIRTLAWTVGREKFTLDSQGERRLRPPEIILAAREGNAARLRELLEAGADIDQLDVLGRTPLFWAAETGHVEAARSLFAASSSTRCHH